MRIGQVGLLIHSGHFFVLLGAFQQLAGIRDKSVAGDLIGTRRQPEILLRNVAEVLCLAAGITWTHFVRT